MRLEEGVYHPVYNHAWVFLDDVRQHYAIMADSELGVMELLVVDERGCFMLDERGEEVKTIIKRGRVWILDSRITDVTENEDHDHNSFRR